MKRALIVGINYEGTGHALRGCINDANNMKSMLQSQYGFTEIEMLLEKAATTDAIKAALARLITGAKVGDSLVFHYSGHGSQLPSTIEADKWEEIICPIDINWKDKVVTDDFFKQTFSKVPVGVNLTVILDCCHSGTGLDQDETYTPTLTRDFNSGVEFDYFTGLAVNPEVGSRFLPPPQFVVDQIKSNHLEIYEYSTSRDVNKTAMLIAGCAPHQTSADAYIDGKFQGAATYALTQHLKVNPKSSYIDLITVMNQFMVDRKFTQRPQLDGSFRLHAEKVFESWPTALFPVVVAETSPSIPTGGTTTTPTKPPKKRKGWQSWLPCFKKDRAISPKLNKPTMIFIALVVVFALVVLFGSK